MGVFFMATIRDVARLAGVSPSTASRVLHDSKMISDATKKKVRQAMEELDYSPNYLAQSLANKTNNMIGIVLPVREDQPSLSNNPFFMQIIQGIVTVCNERNHMVSLATGQTDEELIQNLVTLIRQGNINKFIFVYSKENDPVFDYIQRQTEAETIVVGSPYAKITKKARYVNNDNVQAGKDLTNFLLKKGYKHIAYVYSNLSEMVQEDRYTGYKDALKSRQEYLLCLENGEQEQVVADFLTQNPEVDAFLACDDMTAVFVQQILMRLNVGVSDYGLAGFNNSLITELVHPSLTSVEIHPYRLGSEAAKLLTEKSDKSYLLVDHTIVERESTK